MNSPLVQNGNPRREDATEIEHDRASVAARHRLFGFAVAAELPQRRPRHLRRRRAHPDAAHPLPGAETPAPYDPLSADERRVILSWLACGAMND
jgi:hypothetical protein